MKKTMFMAFVILAILLNFNAFPQNVGINSDGSIPDNSAMLDLKAANKGLLIPRISLTGVNDATTIPSPATSLLVYNTTTGSGLTTGYYYNSGTPDTPVWKALTTAVGLTNFTENNYLYNTKYGVKLLARNDAQTDVDFVLSPKGNGSILANEPDGTATGGNNRGKNAVDMQTSREFNTQVSSGNYSVIAGGNGNTASGLVSIVSGGEGNTSPGIGSVVSGGIINKSTGNFSVVGGGDNNVSSGDYSVILGGSGNTSPSYAETVLGYFNSNYTPGTNGATQANATDRLFAIGNGTESERSNALTILKNANTTIGGSLIINGNGSTTSFSFPASRGTSGQVLTTNGTGVTSWGTPYPGLTNFTESNYTYNTKTGVKLLATNLATDVDFVISPKGSGAIIAQQPDGTGMSGGIVGGGNERGSNAVDLQTQRITNTQVASGDNSVIIGGFGNTASGHNSTAMGGYTKATGNYAVSMGGTSTASGSYSISTGSHTQASGDYSTAIGAYTTAPSGYETVIGRYNTEYTPTSILSWDNNDRLFVIGNGTSASARNNALTILKNASTTIGGSLTINGNGTGTSITLPATRGTSGHVLITDGSGGTGWAAQAGGTVTGVTGTSPIVSTGGNTPVISISPATTTEAGSMSAADKAKLDAQATGNTPGQMQYWNGTAWLTIAAGKNGQILKYKKGVPTWVDGNINDLSIGDSFQGGIIAYFLVAGDPGYDANVKHGLIAAPDDQSTGIQWYNGSNMVTGATDRNLGTGNANTNKIVLAQGPGSYAAQLCADLELGGYSDWYLPSRYELENLELNKIVIGGFADDWYWSSTEFSDNYAERVDFGYHMPPITIATRDINYHVRAIRSF